MSFNFTTNQTDSSPRIHLNSIHEINLFIKKIINLHKNDNYLRTLLLRHNKIPTHSARHSS